MKILIIRRENIGDLILTTPLIALLGRDHKIDILVNTYNSQVIDENPHLNKVYLYTKLHHEKSLKAKVSAILLRVKTSLIFGASATMLPLWPVTGISALCSGPGYLVQNALLQ